MTPIPVASRIAPTAPGSSRALNRCLGIGMARAAAAGLGIAVSVGCGDPSEPENSVASGETLTDTGADIPTGRGDPAGAQPATGVPTGSQSETGPQPSAGIQSGTGSDSGALPGPDGCATVHDPGQILEYDLQLTDSDWQALLADATNSVYFPAELRCGGGAPLSVALRRKRSGGATKVGLKVDINRTVEQQTFSGLKKLSLENGVSDGDGEFSAHALLSEYLAWRMMVLSGAVTGRAAMARVRVNAVDLGVYVNVEQVDKTFLASHLPDDSGWLYKKSGNDNGDGYQTREGEANPYAANLCFWDQSGCAVPSASELENLLPQHLDIEQALRVAAVQALIANTDAFPLKNNNVIFYDWSGGRLYFPWDLDTTMNRSFDVFTGTVPGGTRRYMDILFSNWRADYARVLGELLRGPLTLDIILGELDAILAVAGDALAADPWLDSGADGGDRLRSWWVTQHAAVLASVEAQ